MYAIIDVEATGGSISNDKMIEVAIHRFDGESVIDSFSTLLNPGMAVPPYIAKLTGINSTMVAKAPYFYEVAKRIVEITEGAVLVGHAVRFDYAMVKAAFRDLGFEFRRKKLCTLDLSKKILPNLGSYSLANLCEHLSIDLNNHHRANEDAKATITLFQHLLNNDQSNYLKVLLNRRLKQEDLPPNLALDIVQNLPEETGIYCFKDDKGNIIYVGKSIDIRKRILQHIAKKYDSEKQSRMIRSIHDISYKITGSDLVAQLIEDYKIKEIRPRYNKAQKARGFPYGLYMEVDIAGYQRLKIKKITSKNSSPPLAKFEKLSAGEKSLRRKVKNFNLCLKLAGLERTAGSCFNYRLHQCSGACLKKESSENYNQRVKEAIEYYQYPHDNLLIIGNGRNPKEKSVVWVENRSFKGLGYFDAQESNNTNTIMNSIELFPENPEADKITHSFLKRNKVAQIIPL